MSRITGLPLETDIKNSKDSDKSSIELDDILYDVDKFQEEEEEKVEEIPVITTKQEKQPQLIQMI